MDLNYSVKDCVLVDITTFNDDRGAISVMDKELPFDVRRVFWLYNIKENKERGSHAQLYSAEVIIAIHGSFVVDLDDTETKVSILLNNPCEGLIIRPGIWFRTHSYKDDGVALVLASDYYARDRYIYNYEEYKLLRNKLLPK